CLTLSRVVFFFSSRRRHTRSKRDWSSDVCSSDLLCGVGAAGCVRRLYYAGISLAGRGGYRSHRIAAYAGKRCFGKPFPPEWIDRSEERRVGKEWRSQGASNHSRIQNG